MLDLDEELLERLVPRATHIFAGEMAAPLTGLHNVVLRAQELDE